MIKQLGQLRGKLKTRTRAMLGARSVVLAFLLISTTAVHSANAGLVNFGVVEDDLYRGSMPLLPSQFKHLQELGVKTLLDLQDSPWDRVIVQELAKSHGITLIQRPISPIIQDPSKEILESVLGIMADKSLRPLYVHCLGGRDRTGLAVGLYRIHVDHWTADAAYKEMRANGFNPVFLIGLYLAFRRYEALGSLTVPSPSEVLD